MLTDLTIGKRLLLLIIFNSILLLGVGLTGLSNLNHNNTYIVSSYRNHIEKIHACQLISSKFTMSSIWQMQFLREKDPAEQAKLLSHIRNDFNLREIEESLAGMGKLDTTTKEEADIIALLTTSISGYANAAKQLIARIDTLGPNIPDLATDIENLLKTERSILEHVLDLSTLEQDRAAKDGIMSTKDFHATWQFSLVIILFGIVIMILMGIPLIRTISHSLHSVVAELQKAATGRADLTLRMPVSSSDEVGQLSQSYNNLMDHLLALLKRIQRSVEQVNSSSSSLSTTTATLDTTLDEVSNLTDEVAKTAKGISATSKSLVDTMGTLTEVTSTTADLASSGQTGIVRMSSTMEQMQKASSNITQRLAHIREKTKNITHVVTTITNIADQTFLLSLNASIEAEKAGEYGLGFSVVAREIRRLADLTARATLDISRMVEEMETAVTSGVKGMDQFTNDVKRDSQEVLTVGNQLAQIITHVQALSPQIEKVHQGVQMQSQDAGSINTSMLRLSDSVHKINLAMDETNRVIEQLRDAGKGLQTEVSRFATGQEVT